MFVYVHGFASGPGSLKARFFVERFAKRGITVLAPAMDENDFEQLTLSKQLAFLERTFAGQSGPHVLLGSSLGAYVSALYAATHPVDAIVLLAPAFDFADRWKLRPEYPAWERDGFTTVYHFAQQRDARVSINLLRDAAKYPGFPQANCPALVLHGNADVVVPLYVSEQWCRDRPSARLIELTTTHEMHNVTDRLWDETLAFLRGVPSVSVAYGKQLV